ncbi:DUF1629 domain-containing protein [Xanthobacter sp. KR7-65]|uniref:imm11 family protein n=1 Tax=Xanthobacter sp. KR7-65 TaxID=3156612 RepID=UPI0032B542D0
MSPNTDARHYLDPEFGGGRHDYRRDAAIGDRFVKGATLDGYFGLHYEAPIDFVRAAPTEMIISSHRQLEFDFGFGLIGGFGLTSRSFKNLYRKLESTGNQFIDIEYTIDKRGKEFDKKYCLMNVTRVLNAVDIDRSNVELRETQMPMGGIMKSMRVNRPFHVVLRRDIVGSFHLWHGSIEDLYKVFVSEELKELIEQNGLKKLDYTEVDVI